MRHACLLFGTLIGLMACDGDPVPMADAGPGEFDPVFTSIIDGRCNVVGCHRGPGATGGLDMSTADAAYANLVDVATDERSNCSGFGVRVVPGDAEGSVLFTKVRLDIDAALVCGDQMPLVGERLSDAEVAQVRAWIEGGALR